MRQLIAVHGWGNPAGRVDTPASPVLPLEGGAVALTGQAAEVHAVLRVGVGDKVGEVG